MLQKVQIEPSSNLVCSQGARWARSCVLSLLFCSLLSALPLPVRGQNYSPGNDPDTDNPTGSCSDSPGVPEALTPSARELKEILFGPQSPNPGESWRGGRKENGRKMFPSLSPPPVCTLRKQQFKGTVAGSGVGFRAGRVRVQGGAWAAFAPGRGLEVSCPSSNSPAGGEHAGCAAPSSPAAASLLAWS